MRFVLALCSLFSAFALQSDAHTRSGVSVMSHMQGSRDTLSASRRYNLPREDPRRGLHSV